ncbi:MAG: SAM hydroxide adenosyltransferase, partial [Bacteroidota bacterium]
FDNFPNPVIEITSDKLTGINFKETISHIIQKILEGVSLDALGVPTTNLLNRFQMNPVVGEHYIRGVVVHIDNYENVIININKDLFEQYRKGRNFAIYFKHNDPIRQISQHYHEVPIGETLCLFNSSEYLEIAINMGQAASLLGLKLEETIQIDFEEDDATGKNEI